MGQRLVLELKNNDKTFANIYYHWSAYTVPALETLSEIYDVIKGLKTEDEIISAIIKHLYTSETPNLYQSRLEHGGLTPEDLEAAKKRFLDLPWESFDYEAVNRSCGLLQITEETMGDALDWAEGIISYDISTGVINNQVLYEYSNKEEFEDESYLKLDEVVEIEDDPTCFHISDLGIMYAFWCNNNAAEYHGHYLATIA